MLPSLGVTVMEVRAALVTVNAAVPTSLANRAVIVAVPGAIPLASPLVPAASLTVAIEIGDEVHDTEFVRSSVLPSANTPMAPNCTLVCSATTALPGLICTDVSAEDSTTTLPVPVTEPSCAVMVALPGDWPVTWP